MASLYLSVLCMYVCVLQLCALIHYQRGHTFLNSQYVTIIDMLTSQFLSLMHINLLIIMHTIHNTQSSVAIIPLVIYFSGLVATFFLKKLNDLVGRYVRMWSIIVRHYECIF